MGVGGLGLTPRNIENDSRFEPRYERLVKGEDEKLGILQLFNNCLQY